MGSVVIYSILFIFSENRVILLDSRRFHIPNYTLNKKGDLGKDPLLLDPILEYYEKDMQYLGYGLDKTNWKLTF